MDDTRQRIGPIHEPLVKLSFGSYPRPGVGQKLNHLSIFFRPRLRLKRLKGYTVIEVLSRTWNLTMKLKSGDSQEFDHIFYTVFFIFLCWGFASQEDEFRCHSVFVIGDSWVERYSLSFITHTHTL
jgi:hypothetical protein